MAVDNWDEIRTAYQVARMGTVSGAADVLGVHHATVIRHIDALEGKLGVKLFQRHARGYTATEAGEDLMQVAQTTEDQFTQLAGRIHGRGAAVSGDLVITSVPPMSQLLAQTIGKFQLEYPDLRTELVVDSRVLRLEYGEAHVAIRAGRQDQEPDNIVQPLGAMTTALYATKDYVARHGTLKGLEDIPNHRFVRLSTPNSRIPFNNWIMANVPSEYVVYKASSLLAVEDAVIEGVGIGFLPVYMAQNRDNLVEMIGPQKDWSTPLWIVTHVDLHRTAKVQSFTKFLKEESVHWPTI
ncbi:LysR family transcriptional regulator [Algirhabdus cladophorae]|uniref:LysR family transcriptional regulator n=1 Tax=Algirhabdus cladophorae TaxID=3377108 RepID=UPI003B8496D2